MSSKADSRLAEFLRRVLAGDNDVTPAEVIFGHASVPEVQLSMAQQFASSIRETGYIEPADGPEGDMTRVRVTPQGQEWLDGHDQKAPTFHPRFSS